MLGMLRVPSLEPTRIRDRFNLASLPWLHINADSSRNKLERFLLLLPALTLSSVVGFFATPSCVCPSLSDASVKQHDSLSLVGDLSAPLDLLVA